MAPPAIEPVILVLAGVNGAGKSSLAGSRLREARLQYFNPDEAAERIRRELGCSLEEANALAWREGADRLQSAIDRRDNFAIESTLGGNTIPAMLAEAARSEIDVFVWFIGLASPELHIARDHLQKKGGRRTLFGSPLLLNTLAPRSDPPLSVLINRQTRYRP